MGRGKDGAQWGVAYGARVARVRVVIALTVMFGLGGLVTTLYTEREGDREICLSGSADPLLRYTQREKELEIYGLRARRTHLQ